MNKSAPSLLVSFLLDVAGGSDGVGGGKTKNGSVRAFLFVVLLRVGPRLLVFLLLLLILVLRRILLLLMLLLRLSLSSLEMRVLISSLQMSLLRLSLSRLELSDPASR